MSRRIGWVALLAAVAAVGCGDGKEEAKAVTLPSGLVYFDLKQGTGRPAAPGDRVAVHYTGWLASNNKKFDSSRDRGEPFGFVIGKREVIQGWDEGVAGMRVGGKRRLVIPHKLGYGEEGRPPTIPGSADLVFEVELMDIKAPPVQP